MSFRIIVHHIHFILGLFAVQTFKDAVTLYDRKIIYLASLCLRSLLLIYVEQQRDS